MPGYVLHGLLVHNLLNDWQRCCDIPLKVHEPHVRNAFIAGAMGPDMGLAPGCDRLISDLAHYVHSGDLMRAFIEQAEREIEIAFAWGWCSHVVADVIFHPLINRAVGEWLYNDNQRSVSYAESPSAHMRIEVGLDGACLSRCEPGQQLYFGPVFDSSSIDYVRRVYSDIYGRQVASKIDLWHAHRRASSLSRLAIKFTEMVRAKNEGVRLPFRLWPWNGLYAALKLGSSLSAPASETYAVTHTVSPSEWLLDQVSEEIWRYPNVFFQLATDGVDQFPNYNLDLGFVEDSQHPYGPTAMTLEELAALTGSPVVDETP